MRRADRDDIPTLLALMSEFYSESGYALDHALAAAAFAAILSDERLGYVWLIDEGSQNAGDIVVTMRFGMEYGGLMDAGRFRPKRSTPATLFNSLAKRPAPPAARSRPTVCP